MDTQPDDERAPLLQSVEEGASRHVASAPAVNPEEEVPYASASNSEVIQCHVCKSPMDIRNKKDTFVVKCNVCNEATPIRKAPPKKRYIRCSCHCLLICFENAQRIVCPRSNCKKIITVKDVPGAVLNKSNPTGNFSSQQAQSSQQRTVAAQNSYLNNSHYRPPSMPSQTSNHLNLGSYVICVHCGNRFSFNTLLNTLARCNSCRRLSSVGKEFSRIRGGIFFALFLMFAAVGLGVQFGAASYSDSYLVIALYAILYLISAIFFFKSIYYLSMKISHIDRQGNSAM